MKELELLQLTELDFKMINDGLDALPHKEVAGEMMLTLLTGLLTKDNPEQRDEMMREQKKERVTKEREKALLMEEVKILQGKLLMFQRYLRQNGLLKEANDILSKP